MEFLKSEDKLTTKYIHSDKSETSIKLENSGKFDTKLNLEKVDNNKFSMVISCSKGCIMSCVFCHLTVKNANHSKIPYENLLTNMKEALSAQVISNPEIKDKYIKLCFMGEGEPLKASSNIREATIAFLEWVFQKGYAKGLDGVDIATVLPNIGEQNRAWKDLRALQYHLPRKFNINPVRSNKSVLRLFYSLHSANQVTRNKLIPNAMPITAALPKLKAFTEDAGIDLIIHYMFMAGVNDSVEDVAEVEELLTEYDLQNKELRILRFNTTEDLQITESPILTQVLGEVQEWSDNLKVQYSSGADVQSACGMFVVNT